MAEQLANYIEKERKKGFDDKKIRQTLLKSGFSEEKIDRAFASIGAKTEFKALKEEKQDKKAEEITKSTELSQEFDESKKSLNAVKALLILIAIVVLVLGFIYLKDSGLFNKSGPADQNDIDDVPGTGSGAEPGAESDEGTEYILDEHHNKIPLEGAGCDYPMKTKSRMCRAILSNDRLICDVIEKEDDKAECRELVIAISAIRDNNKELCSEMTTMPESFCNAIVDEDEAGCSSFGSEEGAYCMELVALARGIRTRDTGVCVNNPYDEYDDDFFRDICEAFVENKEGSCDKFFDIKCP